FFHYHLATGKNPTGHRSLHFYQLASKRAHQLHFSFFVDYDVFAFEATAELTLKLDSQDGCADQTATHVALDLGGLANRTITIEIPFRRNHQRTASPDRSAIRPNDLVVLEINVSSAKRTNGRSCVTANLSPTVTFKAAGDNRPLNTQQTLYLFKKCRFFRASRQRARHPAAFCYLNIPTALPAVSRLRQLRL